MQKRDFFSSDTAIMNQPLSHNSVAEIISESKLSGDRALAIIDSALDNVELLIAGVKAGTEVLVLHPHEDGVEQITAALRQNNQFSSVHLIAHGRSGSLQLGSTRLSLENIDSYAQELQVWSKYLSETPLLIYGCELAQGRKGKNFIDRLQELTKTDIAASTTKIGNSQQGGNWQLDYQLGKVAPEIVLTEEIQSTYSGVFVQVGLSVTTDYGPDNSVLVEDQNNNITFRFDLDEAAPTGGLTVYVRGDLFIGKTHLIDEIIVR